MIQEYRVLKYTLAKPDGTHFLCTKQEQINMADAGDLSTLKCLHIYANFNLLMQIYINVLFVCYLFILL